MKTELFLCRLIDAPVNTMIRRGSGDIIEGRRLILGIVAIIFPYCRELGLEVVVVADCLAIVSTMDDCNRHEEKKEDAESIHLWVDA